MADKEFDTEFPDLKLLTIDSSSLEDEAGPRIMVDENVIAKLPAGSHSVYARSHGSSMWTQTARVETTQADETQKSYFLKAGFYTSTHVASGDLGLGMVEGEFESMKSIHDVLEDFCPKPLAWGTFKSNPDLHFFLCDFREMDQDIPEMDRFTSMLAEFHSTSSARSPNGHFGNHCTTYNGNLAQDNSWTDSWEEYFKDNIVRMLQLEEEARGPSPELKQLAGPFLEKVIPRLLRPLETQGNILKPCLIHGDLWYGNTSTDLDTGEPITFDASSFWDHNEYEVRTMRPAGVQFGRAYLKAYHARYPISPPEEDHEDRLALYAILVEQMRLLADKYPDGYGEPISKASL
ncbi:hypothetical protein HYALB_00013936 [Hymenoscyphus albidus]|uniref:protein-ribulosamine 3-kinase n=1 Tax=Hymenoscyphus albidus TaxID=595503 RepID=A0A9N9LZP9_9HELO|nr:hypothetical protein HYALB_00013936 [Hymenoscyphus albidus]